MAEKLMDQIVNTKEKGHSGKDRKRHERAFSSMVVHLGDQIAGRNIKSDAGRKGQGIRHGSLDPAADQIKS